MRDICRKIKIVIKYLEMLKKCHEHKPRCLFYFIENRPKESGAAHTMARLRLWRDFIDFQMIFQTFILV